MMFWSRHEYLIERNVIEVVQDRFQKNQLFNRYPPSRDVFDLPIQSCKMTVYGKIE
jgi:hypothetical protein